MCLQLNSNACGRQVGAALIVSMIMLLIVVIIGNSLATIGFTHEKAARNERDRTVALHSAELALADAELDLENSTATTSRSTIFSPDSAEGFSDGCSSGAGNIYQGLCLQPFATSAEMNAALNNAGANSPSVQFGRFTGHTLSAGYASLACQLPRYIIELLKDNAAGQTADIRFIYRITAIGFGADIGTQVVLESVYKKAGRSP